MGEINGRVIDTNTHLPLVGANIQIVDYGIGSATDSDGFFSIANIPIGTTHIEITMIGYEKYVLLNLPITAVRPLNLKIELNVVPVLFDMIDQYVPV